MRRRAVRARAACAAVPSRGHKLPALAAPLTLHRPAQALSPVGRPQARAAHTGCGAEAAWASRGSRVGAASLCGPECIQPALTLPRVCRGLLSYQVFPTWGGRLVLQQLGQWVL